ncbi:kdtB [Wigglesworthia glossinidia endosymbiont of Glossina brevipalpis]|uniref:Phosphopantetheine adenylyltransferase n=1 Tax=Wigglesworthia glossinidia brevipalpis TaxID=36870 RepID=COAD_WIGBR|nr:RecName: Full=Phosphopantetheine adenylyltransferase; AltName: Full=Dephospho-CoA pyrophosphorylase; AltName: Full=Pantetheine-phosphate adenylyltransferase; Short=PPAT [Wigglesworthia glossinidia endosymbiont of Glossina brevipalpis]BAC24435.1 kdtB [Wigglesworthia glossinidia endosymbiont of Glossina brevipalpis]
MKNKKAIFPGTFDPLTNGHINLIERSIKVFDKVIIIVANNFKKNQLFNLKERMHHIKKATKNYKNIKVIGINDLTTNFARKNNIKILIRGIRNIFDFENEFIMEKTNKYLYPEMESIFMISDINWSYMSSSMIKEIIFYGGNLDYFLPECVIKDIKKKIKRKIVRNLN